MKTSDPLTFKRLTHKRYYEDVVTQFKGKIQKGELKVGDRLPTENEIMKELGVSKSSLREGLRVLESEGLIISLAGEGRFIREADPNTLFRSTGLIGAFEFSRIFDLLEAREAFEPRISFLAAKRARPQEIDELKQIVDSMSMITRKSFADLESELFRLDNRFHQTLATASRNMALANLVNLSLVISQETRKRILVIPGRDQILIEELSKIVHAVERHDAHAASAAMKRHLLGVRKATKEVQKIAHRTGINKPIGQSEGGDEVRRDRYQTEDSGKQNNME